MHFKVYSLMTVVYTSGPATEVKIWNISTAPVDSLSHFASLPHSLCLLPQETTDLLAATVYRCAFPGIFVNGIKQYVLLCV